MNPLYWRPGQRSAVSIGGSRPNANYFLLDGATNTDPTFSTQNLSASPDAVQEFQVQTGSYSADMGGAGGGQINIVTRSGTGALSRHRLRVPAQRRDGCPLVQPDGQLEISWCRTTLAHRSAAQSRTRQDVLLRELRRSAATSKPMSMVDTVPTAEEASGDFSQSGVDIYDPTTTAAEPELQSQPAGQQDESAIHPAAVSSTTA